MESPPPLPPDFLHPTSKDISDTFSTPTAAEISKLIEQSRKDSAVGNDQINY